jgi:hypothetical protein
MTGLRRTGSCPEAERLEPWSSCGRDDSVFPETQSTLHDFRVVLTY